MNKNKDQLKFEALLDKLQKKFQQAPVYAETDEEIGRSVLDFILQRERLRRGVTNKPEHCDAVDLETMQAMQSWDSNDPMLSTVEKILKRLSTNRLSDSAQLLKAAINAKKMEITNRQTTNALHPRKKHPVTALIESMVRSNPKITAPELEEKLRGQIGNGVISNMDKETIDPEDMKFKSAKVSGLKDHLSRIKKNIAKAG
jgi:hypothetical protein